MITANWAMSLVGCLWCHIQHEKRMHYFVKYTTHRLFFFRIKAQNRDHRENIWTSNWVSWKQSLRGKRCGISHKNSLIKKTLIKFIVHSFIKFILNSYLKGMYLPICASLYINYCQNLTIIMIKALLVLKIRKYLSGCNYTWLLWTMNSTDYNFWWRKKIKPI